LQGTTDIQVKKKKENAYMPANPLKNLFDQSNESCAETQQHEPAGEYRYLSKS
jgi:hypothetical protein